MGEAIEIISAGILVFLIFLGMASPVLVICLVYFLKKRLDHKQVMAVIVGLKTPKADRPVVDKKSYRRYRFAYYLGWACQHRACMLQVCGFPGRSLGMVLCCFDTFRYRYFSSDTRPAAAKD